VISSCTDGAMHSHRCYIESLPVLSFSRQNYCLLACVLLLALGGCSRREAESREYAWVSAPQVNLRDRVAALYNKVAIVMNGQRVEVLERQKRFVRVRTDDGKEGWLEQRYLVGSDVHEALDRLAQQSASAPTQGEAVTRNTVNMHVTPGRETDYLYQLKEAERVQLIRRATAEKAARPAAPPVKRTPPAKAAASSATKGAQPEAPMAQSPAVQLEDWWLIRDAQKHVGWVLGRMLDIDVPVEVAQYAEGQRIVGAHVLNYVNDPGYEPPKADDSAAPASPPATAPSGDPHKRPQYLVLLSEPRDGLPFDYNQARVFSWNTKRHRYETAYRERNFEGVLPVSIGEENFDREGTLPTFTLRVKAQDGSIAERRYRLNGPIVRRVQQPGEAAAAKPVQPARAARPAVKRKRR
jgi:SH3-like domain-containing protein